MICLLQRIKIICNLPSFYWGSKFLGQSLQKVQLKDIAQVSKATTELYLVMASYRHQSQPGVALSRRLSKKLFSLKFGCCIGHEAVNGQFCSRAHADTAYLLSVSAHQHSLLSANAHWNQLCLKAFGKGGSHPIHWFSKSFHKPPYKLAIENASISELRRKDSTYLSP